MDEPEFWGRLEYRVCAELDGMKAPEARRYWCDGFEPRRYIIDGRSPRILGRGWMGIGPRDQEQWEFTLLLDRPVGSQEGIDWSALLPPPDVTRWLTVDPAHKHLVIEPGVAVPDSTSPRSSKPDPAHGGRAARGEGDGV